MRTVNRMRVGHYEFLIEKATFRFITQSWSGPGWDFHFRGLCLNDNPEMGLFPNGARIFTEAIPLPLKKVDDLTGIELYVPLSYDEETGEALFGLQVMEEHDLSNLRLKFLERDGQRYLIEINATVSKTLLGHPESFSLSAWTEQLPDHAYPV